MQLNTYFGLTRLSEIVFYHTKVVTKWATSSFSSAVIPQNVINWPTMCNDGFLYVNSMMFILCETYVIFVYNF